jgi:hypothetical protein
MQKQIIILECAMLRDPVIEGTAVVAAANVLWLWLWQLDFMLGFADAGPSVWQFFCSLVVTLVLACAYGRYVVRRRK